MAHRTPAVSLVMPSLVQRSCDQAEGRVEIDKVFWHSGLCKGVQGLCVWFGPLGEETRRERVAAGGEEVKGQGQPGVVGEGVRHAEEGGVEESREAMVLELLGCVRSCRPVYDQECGLGNEVEDAV